MKVTERTPLLRSEAGSEPTFSENDIHKGTVSRWRRAFGIILALIGVFIAGADQSFLMVIYERIASSFGSVSDSAWVLTGYNLGYCIALPVYGKMSDAYGRKIPLVISYCLFSIGCVFSGTGVHLWQVIAGRIITGLGGAGMVALVSVIITDNVLPNQVALMRSYVNVVNVTGRAFGGLIGAVITDAVGWRWSFIIQAPFALLCCTVCMILLSTEKKTKISHQELTNAQDPQKIDYLGIAAFTITITSLLASIELFGRGKSEITTALILMCVAFCFGVLFLLIEGYYAKEPLIPPFLLKTISGIYLLIQMLLLLGRQAHVSSLVPYFSWTEGLDTTSAALKFVPSPLGFTAGSIIAGYIIQRTNTYKVLSIVSLIFGTLVYLLIAIRWGDSPYSWEFLYILPAGLGLGVVLSCTFTGLTMVTPKHFQATAICMYYLCQQVGGIIGTALATVALHTIFKNTLEDRLTGIPDKSDVIRDILNNAGSQGLPEALQDTIRSSYRHSFQSVSILPSLATALALSLVLLIPEIKSS